MKTTRGRALSPPGRPRPRPPGQGFSRNDDDEEDHVDYDYASYVEDGRNSAHCKGCADCCDAFSSDDVLVTRLLF